ncbi:TPA: putative JmjC domain-containing histone demethylation protein 2C [Trebouxia sp. C0004]
MLSKRLNQPTSSGGSHMAGLVNAGARVGMSGIAAPSNMVSLGMAAIGPGVAVANLFAGFLSLGATGSGQMGKKVDAIAATTDETRNLALNINNNMSYCLGALDRLDQQLQSSIMLSQQIEAKVDDALFNQQLMINMLWDLNKKIDSTHGRLDQLVNQMWSVENEHMVVKFGVVSRGYQKLCDEFGTAYQCNRQSFIMAKCLCAIAMDMSEGWIKKVEVTGTRAKAKTEVLAEMNSLLFDIKELLDGKQPKDIAEAVFKSYKRAEYVRFTIRMDSATTPTAASIVETRQARVPSEWWGPHTDQLVDLHNTTMIFMAKKTCFTAPHADWADAYNIAFAIDAIKGQKNCVQDMPLAKWVFFHPFCVKHADAWVRANANDHGFSRDAKGFGFHLNQEQIAKLQAHLGDDPRTGLAYVRVVYQFHGERMYVPAGWVHQVENLQDCVKLAWDFFGSAERLAVCFAAWQHVHAKLADINAPDYLCASAVLCRAVQQLS